MNYVPNVYRREAAKFQPAVVYFHGINSLGFPRDALVQTLGSRPFLYPRLTNDQVRGLIQPEALTFLAQHPGSIVAGYSLGRIPVFHLMQQQAQGMTRAIIIDPTWDDAPGTPWGIGGGIVKAWLDGSSKRTFLLVYGDSTREMGGETSYFRELSRHPRAELCYIPGRHPRFKYADMAQALVAANCLDLLKRLGIKPDPYKDIMSHFSYPTQTSNVRHLYDPISGQMVIVRPRPGVMVGAAIPTTLDPPTPKEEESYTINELVKAFKSVTPTLLLVGIATGFAFAVGAGLASRLIPSKHR